MKAGILSSEFPGIKNNPDYRFLMDLTRSFPRSPKETLHGLAHVPRMIDKAKAKNRGALGEYIYPCPLDDIMLEFLGTNGDEFARMAETGEMDRWVGERCAGKSDSEKKTVNHKILQKKPDTEEKQRRFADLRNAIDPAREDVQTWAELIDLEEGRI